jgi:dihydrofolate reductase
MGKEVPMRSLTVFNSVSLDGYFTGENGDLSWVHSAPKDPEFDAFVAENAKGGGVLVMGRVTYDMMTKYWPTPEAKKNDPVVAERMNGLEKIVFSRKMDGADWSNTRLVKTDPVREIRRLKSEGGKDLVVLGSGTIVSQLARADLVDQYQLVLVPVILGKGRTMFEGLEGRPALTLTNTRTFGNGNALLCYERAA